MTALLLALVVFPPADVAAAPNGYVEAEVCRGVWQHPQRRLCSRRAALSAVESATCDGATASGLLFSSRCDASCMFERCAKDAACQGVALRQGEAMFISAMDGFSTGAQEGQCFVKKELVRCSQECAADGICEDGGALNVATSCTLGGDCADCGARPVTPYNGFVAGDHCWASSDPAFRLCNNASPTKPKTPGTCDQSDSNGFISASKCDAACLTALCSREPMCGGIHFVGEGIQSFEYAVLLWYLGTGDADGHQLPCLVKRSRILCSNTCKTARDGVCQSDGCLIGTDCADCGPRLTVPEGIPVPWVVVRCTEDCALWSGDGKCHDGGIGSVSNVGCNLGDDCTDCGVRATLLSPSRVPATSSPSTLTTPPLTNTPHTFAPKTSPPSTLTVPPLTNAPHTFTPKTRSPATLKPYVLSHAPDTTAPETAAPVSTGTPGTRPPTLVPVEEPTPSPSTVAPATDPPATPKPRDAAAPTTVPDTPTPSTLVPVTVAPTTAVQNVGAPTLVPATGAPTTAVPVGPLDLCRDACGSMNGDGICDDGGDRASNFYCSLGRDCSDCGIRTAPFVVSTCGVGRQLCPGPRAACSGALRSGEFAEDCGQRCALDRCVSDEDCTAVVRTDRNSYALLAGAVKGDQECYVRFTLPQTASQAPAVAATHVPHAYPSWLEGSDACFPEEGEDISLDECSEDCLKNRCQGDSSCAGVLLRKRNGQLPRMLRVPTGHTTAVRCMVKAPVEGVVLKPTELPEVKGEWTVLEVHDPTAWVANAATFAADLGPVTAAAYNPATGTVLVAVQGNHMQAASEQWLQEKYSIVSIDYRTDGIIRVSSGVALWAVVGILLSILLLLVVFARAVTTKVAHPRFSGRHRRMSKTSCVSEDNISLPDVVLPGHAPASTPTDRPSPGYKSRDPSLDLTRPSLDSRGGRYSFSTPLTMS